MTKQRTRMADIAAHAGVSTATVSRVVNGTGPVSEETRHRVLVAIDSYGYERPAGESSSTGAPVIGVITPELTNPIFATFAHTLQSEISRSGAVPLICSQTPGGTSEETYTEALLSRGAAGIIFVSGRHADYRSDISRYLRLIERGFPFVTVNGAREEIAAQDFSTGDGLGIQTAVRHLHSLGHTRIALLGGHTHIVPAARKADAFRAVMAQEHLDDDPPVIETFYTYEAAAAATADLVGSGVTAIVAGSDLQALGAIRTIHALGLSVPDDLSVIGFDDSVLMAHLDPPLTTIRQPVSAITTAAVQALLASISDGTHRSGAFVYTPDLVVRGSTGPAAVGAWVPRTATATVGI